jgi:hypothetical protein
VELFIEDGDRSSGTSRSSARIVSVSCKVSSTLGIGGAVALLIQIDNQRLLLGNVLPAFGGVPFGLGRLPLEDGAVLSEAYSNGQASTRPAGIANVRGGYSSSSNATRFASSQTSIALPSMNFLARTIAS